MAITFIQQKKRQRYLVWVLGGVAIIGIFFLGQSFLKKEKVTTIVTISPEIAKMAKKIEVNTNILKNPVFKILTPFEEFNFTQDKPGRENPFTPF